MPGLDASEVRVAGSGGVFVAPEGTTLPTDVATDLPAAWINLGYISEDGATVTLSRDQEEVNAWQASDPVRVLVTNEPKTVTFELLQFEPVTIQLAFRGGEVTSAGTGEWKFTPPDAGATDIRAMVVEGIDGSITTRYVFARVQLQGDVETALVRSDAQRLPMEFGVQAAEPIWGYILSNDPEWEVLAPVTMSANGSSTRKSSSSSSSSSS
jgi:hypothetical protein